MIWGVLAPLGAYQGRTSRRMIKWRHEGRGSVSPWGWEVCPGNPVQQDQWGRKSLVHPNLGEPFRMARRDGDGQRGVIAGGGWGEVRAKNRALNLRGGTHIVMFWKPGSLQSGSRESETGVRQACDNRNGVVRNVGWRITGSGQGSGWIPTHLGGWPALLHSSRRRRGWEREQRWNSGFQEESLVCSALSYRTWGGYGLGERLKIVLTWGYLALKSWSMYETKVQERKKSWK